jgi:DtxR family Mn-dependent transcriptional regulator
MLNLSASEENYLKTIFHLQITDENVTTNELADSLKAKPASITDMMKKLKNRKLVHYKPYQGFRLTPDGRKAAIGIVRRHRLWEYFLAEKLKFNWDEVHEVAEQMEHVSSKKLIDKLDEYLGFPRFDPHGDPIPDTNGVMETGKQYFLSDWPENKAAEVCQVLNQSVGLLSVLKQKNITIGKQVVIKKRLPFDNSLEIKTSKNPVSIISEQIAKKIIVKKATI